MVMVNVDFYSASSQKSLTALLVSQKNKIVDNRHVSWAQNILRMLLYRGLRHS